MSIQYIHTFEEINMQYFVIGMTLIKVSLEMANLLAQSEVHKALHIPVTQQPISYGSSYKTL